MIGPIELVFKEVDGLRVSMDIYVPGTATRETPVPVLLWWHGKAFQRLPRAITDRIYEGGGLLQVPFVLIDPHSATYTSINQFQGD